ncbi:hypothetical protein THAOC_17090 [Thalassiosira oceanica]|uniref:Coenzyme F420 hydrogenase/dehydrogenase beta subunit C-terminal domain-containing protein n=2 Tax=Thalassiosira oceanica TaxID=159749 RepID=K0S868_THAOC|nr:hypothetical protein THAOC_17090 [Thalassiosira oceanica]|mmetsp:Transcript_17334/g.39068  ORF Transcript_17334/g.39068 Transcript_17334/m.39068 type:complete len:473 (+) Transcript_17334:160-1578(+)|eukprot:EJK62303.1 hypothetical protein THAOC_17090 [Thalassiosira oceanica]
MTVSAHIPFLFLSLAGSARALSATKVPRPSRPINPDGWPEKFPAKDHCSRCGLCETSYVSNVLDACAFINGGMKRNIDGLEETVHGRTRCIDNSINGDDSIAEERRFGVMSRPMMLGRGKVAGAQWTGAVSSIAVSMLESKKVDAVVCIATGSDGGWSNPEPILARTVDDVLRGRGVKPALAPSLRILDELKSDESIKKLLYCGVGCSVQAFRAIEDELGLDKVYVLGTACADNSPTPKAARDFLKKGIPSIGDSNVLAYEFMQDFRVHVKVGDEKSPSYKKLPYFSLEPSVAEFAIADSCLACFDYTNALADVVVGYMGAPLVDDMDRNMQTITVRNNRGEEMIRCAIDGERLELGGTARGEGTHEKFAMSTVANDNLVNKMTGGDVKEKGMPPFVGNIIASIATKLGPKGVAFARYSIDYHILRNYLHCLREFGRDRADTMIPEYTRVIIKEYEESDQAFRDLIDKIEVS